MAIRLAQVRFMAGLLHRANDGCHLLTEETLNGAFYVEEIGRKNPGSLYRYHQEWVEMLAGAAELKAAR